MWSKLLESFPCNWRPVYEGPVQFGTWAFTEVGRKRYRFFDVF